MVESFDLSGRRAFVTGGSKGIGAAIVRRFTAHGATVTFTAQDAVAARPVAEELGAQVVQLDVTDLPAAHRAVSDHGPFDILVNNAGMDQHAFFTHTTMEQWRYLLAVNLEAVFATTHAALPSMQSAGFGRIVNISSEAGRLGSKGGAVYAAAKGGVIAFTQSIARENGRKGITANVIAPGPIDTPLLRKGVQTGGEKLLSAMRAATLLDRLGTTDEVAAAVLFLASDEAGFITGETLGVSGGMGCGA
jgi:NAD(P)-dependent dehydrogenase (short-subunit alcohol dehydrogenase family)